MGIQQRKERERADMQKRILEAAQNIFLADGFDGLSIRKIADVIEYSPATIYLYFKDKDEILYHLHSMGFEQMYRDFIAVPADKSPFERIRQFGEIYLQFGLHNPLMYKLMFQAQEPMRCSCFSLDDMAKYDVFGYLIQTVEAAIEAKQIWGDPQLIAMTLWMNVHGLVSAANDGRLQMKCSDNQEVLTMAHATMHQLMQAYARAC
jgi:AcrR family transcriptional regulator